ncbi:uncharacterized protein LODBEIA_P10650 [Lodderomyces beijingensis]|uniref:Uncharacterized protein n=1 Tax=Lodderomyces beijingensis TaxID=1775926 RepID=A0ABP0ZJ25_9ASCO
MEVSDSEEELAVNYKEISVEQVKKLLARSHVADSEEFARRLESSLGAPVGYLSDNVSKSRSESPGAFLEDHEAVNLVEDEHNLQAYINRLRSGRTLRRRNFASTHPYLSDQAYYLGLADVNYLNELYEENDHDIEAIVKLLNYNYMALKRRYPKDDKYKQKTFFAIIGKQSKCTGNEDSDAQKIGEQVAENSQASCSPNNGLIESFSSQSRPLEYEYDSDSESESTIVRTRTMVISDTSDLELDVASVNGFSEGDESGNNSSNIGDVVIIGDDDDGGGGSDDELYVRVGGRYRKEKSALRGVLPESAKHLPLYHQQSKGKTHTQVSKPRPDKRKGLAVKKTISRYRSKPIQMLDFVDDTEIELESEGGRYPDMLYQDEVPHIVVEELSFSDSHSPSEADTSDTESLFAADDLFANEYGFDGVVDGEAQEDDRVDHMLSHQPRKKPTTSASREHRRADTSELKMLSSPAPTIRRDYTTRKASVQEILRGTASSASRQSTTTKRSRSTTTKRSRSTTTKRSRSTTNNRSTTRNRPKHAANSVSSFFANARSSGGQDIYKALSSRRFRETQSKPRAKRAEASSRLTNVGFFRKSGAFKIMGRDPRSSTVVFEAEVANVANHPMTPVAGRSASTFPTWNIETGGTGSLQPRFDQGCIVNDMRLRELKNSNSGKQFHSFKEPVLLKLQGKDLTLTMLDVSRSSELIQQAFLFWAKGNRVVVLQSSDFYQTLKGFISWYLISQHPPSTQEWSLVDRLIYNMQRAATEQDFFYLPYLVLLHYVMSITAEINGGGFHDSSCSYSLPQIGTWYWTKLFTIFSQERYERMNYAAGNTSLYSESFYVMCTVLDLQGLWCKTLEGAIEACTSEHYDQMLEVTFRVCASFRKNVLNWQPLSKALERIQDWDGRDSRMLRRYLEIVIYMNQRRDWPLEEKTILQIYSNFSSRKFANYPNENGSLEKFDSFDGAFEMGHRSTCFDGFLHILRLYISRQQKVSQIKRLVIKLFASAESNYNNTAHSRSMFTNRFKLILLLCEMTSIDLRTQIDSMVFAVANVDDFQFLQTVINGIFVATEITLFKKMKVPWSALEFMIKKIQSMFYAKHGARKLWRHSMKRLTHVVDSCKDVESVLFFLPLVEFLDSPIAECNEDVAKLCCKLVRPLVASKAVVASDPVSINVVKSACRSALESLSQKMSRHLGGKNLSEATCIECGVELFVKTSYLVDSNWDKLLMQTVYYLGNQATRDHFEFYFYTQVMQFDPLRNHEERIVRAILRNLLNTSLQVSPYLSKLLSTLNKNWSWFKVNKFLLQQGTRASLLMEILKSCEKRFSVGVMTSILLQILQTIHHSLRQNESVPWFKDLCREIVLEVSKLGLAGKEIAPVTRDVIIRLDMEDSELQKLHQSGLTFEEKVVMARSELSEQDRPDGPFCGSSDLAILCSLMRGYVTRTDDAKPWRPMYLCLRAFSVNCFSTHGVDYRDDNFRLFFSLMQHMVVSTSIDIHHHDENEDYDKAVSMISVLLCWCQEILLDGYRMPDFIHDLQMALPHWRYPNPCTINFAIDTVDEMIEKFRYGQHHGSSMQESELFLDFDFEF